jgi:hypothetical protein
MLLAGGEFFSARGKFMARKIDTAETREIELRGGKRLTVQEFSSFGFVQAIGSIRKIVTRIRGAGDLESMFRGLWDAAEDEGGKKKVNVNQLIGLLEMLMGAMGDDPEPLFKIVELSIRDDGKKTFGTDDAHDLMVEDIVPILKAIYELNFTKLKKALTKAGWVKETNDNPSPSPLTSLPVTPSEPLKTPVAS